MHMEADRILAAGTDRTVYQDGESVIKLFEKDSSAEPVFAEAMNAIRAGCAGLPAPEVEGVVRIGERWAIRSRYIEGKTLAYLIFHAPEKKEMYLRKLISLMVQVNRTQSAYPRSVKEMTFSALRDSGAETVCKEAFSERLGQLPDGNTVFHGDLTPSNVLVDGDGTMHLVDWRHAANGTPAAEAAFTCLRFVCDGDRVTAEEFFDLYRKDTGVGREEITAWFPMAAVYLSRSFRKESLREKRDRLSEFIQY